MVALLFCYHFTALCASKGDISASSIYYIFFFFNLLFYKDAFIGLSCCFDGLSYSLHFSPLSLLQHAHSQRLGGS